MLVIPDLIRDPGKNMNSYFVYIMASRKNGTLYIGVTSNLIKRVWEHKNSLMEGFTAKYKVYLLVYFEVFENIELAIQREQQLKKWRREWKIQLIERKNFEWRDLYDEIST